MRMRVRLNGVWQELASSMTVWDFLRQQGIDPEKIGVAVAINREVIPRSRWAEVTIQGEEEIELVYARQGG